MVNEELRCWELLQQPHVLKPGGRAAIITFHFEDRLIFGKFFKQALINRWQMMCLAQAAIVPLRCHHRKTGYHPIGRGIKKEIQSREAKLRVAEMKKVMISCN